MPRLITPRRGRDIPSGVQLARDGVGHIAQLLLLLLEILRARRGGVLVQPVGGFLDGFEELLQLYQPFVLLRGVTWVNSQIPYHQRQSCRQGPPRH